MPAQTLADLFDIAIQLEKTSQALYASWQAAFARHSAVAAFWETYARDEAGHAEALIHARDRLDAEQLSKVVEPGMFELARKLLRDLQRNPPVVYDLDDAYQLAHELEHSEVNTLFEFLMSDTLPDDDPARRSNVQFIRKQISEHSNRLLFEFPQDFGTVQERRALRVAKST